MSYPGAILLKFTSSGCEKIAEPQLREEAAMYRLVESAARRDVTSYFLEKDIKHYNMNAA